jgi:hypothetical protein
LTYPTISLNDLKLPSPKHILEAFVQQAISNELERFDGYGCAAEIRNDDLASLRGQLQRLEIGQKATVAFLDSSARVLASLVRESDARR